MTTRNRIKTVLTLAAVGMAFLVLTTAPADAEVIFTESFEDPVITVDTDYQWVISGYFADGPWPGWVGVNRYTICLLSTSLWCCIRS